MIYLIYDRFSDYANEYGFYFSCEKHTPNAKLNNILTAILRESSSIYIACFGSIDSLVKEIESLEIRHKKTDACNWVLSEIKDFAKKSLFYKNTKTGLIESEQVLKCIFDADFRYYGANFDELKSVKEGKSLYVEVKPDFSKEYNLHVAKLKKSSFDNMLFYSGVAVVLVVVTATTLSILK